MAQVLKIHHAFIVVRDDRTVEVIHHAADGIGEAPLRIILILKYNFLAESLT